MRASALQSRDRYKWLHLSVSSIGHYNGGLTAQNKATSRKLRQGHAQFQPFFLSPKAIHQSAEFFLPRGDWTRRHPGTSRRRNYASCKKPSRRVTAHGAGGECGVGLLQWTLSWTGCLCMRLMSHAHIKSVWSSAQVYTGRINGALESSLGDVTHRRTSIMTSRTPADTVSGLIVVFVYTNVAFCPSVHL